MNIFHFRKDKELRIIPTQQYLHILIHTTNSSISIHEINRLTFIIELE